VVAPSFLFVSGWLGSSPVQVCLRKHAVWLSCVDGGASSHPLFVCRGPPWRRGAPRETGDGKRVMSQHAVQRSSEAFVQHIAHLVIGGERAPERQSDPWL